MINDPDGNRTRVTAVKGRCLNRLTTGPLFSSSVAEPFLILSYNFYNCKSFFLILSIFLLKLFYSFSSHQPLFSLRSFPFITYIFCTFSELFGIKRNTISSTVFLSSDTKKLTVGQSPTRSFLLTFIYAFFF